MIHIRPATAADASTIVDFNLAMALETENRRLNREVVTLGVQRVLAEPQLGHYYIAEIGGQAAGQLLITFEWSDWRGGLFWWIQSVYVSPEHRQSGAYRALHQWVEQRARATPGVCGLRLYVDEENTRAQQVYRRLGMTAANYQMYETDWSGAEQRRL